MKIKKGIHLAVEVSLLAAASLLASAWISEKANSAEKDKTILMLGDNPPEEADVRYKFLEPKVSHYIEALCQELDFDSNLAVAVLMVENPKFDPNAVNKNLNGTVDCGLFQLNDRYIWTVFKNDYWIDDVELDPFNWKHNCFIAVHHLAALQKKLKVMDDAIMAYNCGAGAVMAGRVPYSTTIYLAKVKNNLQLLNSSAK